MEKIKRIKDLKHEQEKLRNRKAELQEQIYTDWGSVKEAVKFKNILKNRFQVCPGNKTERKISWINRLCSQAELFFYKVLQQSVRKIESKLSEKIVSWLTRVMKKSK